MEVTALLKRECEYSEMIETSVPREHNQASLGKPRAASDPRS